MSNLASVVQRLKKERDQAQRRMEQLDEALKALTGLGGRRQRAALSPKKRRPCRL